MMATAMGEQTNKLPPGATTPEPPRYCRGKNCGYNLRGLPTSTTRCPECGREFDPANPKTYRFRPLRRWLKHVQRAALTLAALLLILAATWGWFYWGWYDEQQALRALKVDPDRPPQSMTDLPVCTYVPILGWWLTDRLGPHGFVLYRVMCLRLDFRPDVTDIAPLARLTSLQWLRLRGTPVTDLLPLARLTNLQTLDIDGTGVTDLAPLVRLTNLQWLYLDATRVTDLTPLAGLTNLQLLGLAYTRVTDLTPLARLMNLQDLDLTGTGVTDLGPLGGLASLRLLTVPKETITQAQADALHRHLPDCTITRE